MNSSILSIAILSAFLIFSSPSTAQTQSTPTATTTAATPTGGNGTGPASNGTLTAETILGMFKFLLQTRKEANATTPAFAYFADGLSQRSSRKSRRKALPADWARGGYESPVKCGGAYDVGKNGFTRFDINSPQDTCYHAFIGSRADRCTVGIICDGTVDLANGDPRGGCQDEFIRIGDGTIGISEACGQFSFDGVPRTPRNKGKDMYVLYKGESLGSPCAAFCTEDLEYSQARMELSEKVGKSDWPGFPAEGQGPCECGIRNNIGRVVGGQDASKFEFPWMAAIVFKFPSYERVPFCDGTLISDTHIVTAAHCFDSNTKPSDIQVLLHAHLMDKTPNRGQYQDSDVSWTPGWNLPTATDQSENTIRVEVAEIITHPLFSLNTFDYDVAILKLAEKVNIRGGKVSPICLPYMNEVINYEDQERMTVAGWGTGSEKAKVTNRLLQKLDMPYYDRQSCKSYVPAAKRHICAGFLEGGKDACQGDSGGPLIFNFNPEDSQYMLSGIVSSGAGCARKAKLGLYTDVREVIQWIYHHSVDREAMWCSR